MLGLFGPETVQFVAMSDCLLSFYSPRAKKLDSELKIRIGLTGYKTKSVDIPVKVVGCESMGKGQLMTGAIDMSAQHLKQLEDLLYNYTGRPDLGEAARRSPRLPIGLKVISRDLPGYNCVTVDMSRHGTRLITHAPVESGSRVQLAVDSDITGLGALQLAGRVVACRETSDTRSKNKSYHVCVDFAGLPPAQQDNLDYFNRTVAGRFKGDVMQRQIADGEMTAGATLPVNLGAPPPPPPT